jgi:D-alanine transaminase
VGVHAVTQSEAGEVVYLNGQLVARSEARIDPEDRGFLFGDGIYEVLEVQAGLPLFAQAHYERLVRSAQAIQLSVPLDKDGFLRTIRELVAANGVEEGLVYLQVTRGVAPRSHAFPQGEVPPTVFAFARSQPPDPSLAQGVAAVVLPDQRWYRVDLKTVNLLPNVLASQEARRRGAYEAILVRDGVVTECSHSNVWMVRGGVVYTHPADTWILHGVTRAVTLQAARQAGIDVREEAFLEVDLWEAQELFLTSTTAGVVPIVRINGRPVGTGVPGPVTGQVSRAYRQAVEAELRRLREES